MRNPVKFRPDFKRAKLGDSIIYFETSERGNHVFKWAGTIANFYKGNIPGMVGPQPFARVRVHKRGNLDSRDFGETYEHIPVDDPGLQRLSQTLLIYIR